uniref:Uncharacterized protein n=1 Tax=Anguilla anguilla TaxID=7936 RepID=A0A0E9QQ55_ANGAN
MPGYFLNSPAHPQTVYVNINFLRVRMQPWQRKLLFIKNKELCI